MNAVDIKALLLGRSPLPLLKPTKIWRAELNPAIEALTAPILFKAGLYLWNDDLDACHAIAQKHEIPDGNYWHAILHRREGDYSNSKYWYHRVGDHPCFFAMRARFTGWHAESFVDACAASSKNTRTELEEMQAYEMSWLLTALETIP